MEIKKIMCPENKYDIKCPYILNAEGICVHNTANNASAENEIKYMINNNNKVSFHLAVDDKEAIQGIPFNRNTWNAGDGVNGRGNRKMISIEICYSTSEDINKFLNAEKNAVKLIAQLLKEKNWGVDRIFKHQDFNGKNCPHKTLELGWDRFINMIKEKLGETENTNTLKWQKIMNKVYCCGILEDNKFEEYSDQCAMKHYLYYKIPTIKNEYVGFVQDLLISKGYDCGKWGKDNSYGLATRSAVERFQQDKGLKIDGIVGSATIQELLK